MEFENIKRPIIVFGIIVALLGIISTFLSWCTVTNILVSYSYSGFDLGYGVPYLILCIIMLISYALSVKSHTVLLRTVLPVIYAIICFFLAIFASAYVIEYYEDSLVAVQSDTGLMLAAFVIPVLMIICAVAYYISERSQRKNDIKEPEAAAVVANIPPASEGQCFCRNCGTKIGIDDKFCTACGSEQKL